MVKASRLPRLDRRFCRMTTWMIMIMRMIKATVMTMMRATVIRMLKMERLI